METIRLMPRKPIVPVTQEQRERLMNLPGVLILGKPKEANAWQGFVEHSFSMDWSPEYVNFWWSGNAVSNFGSKHVLDGNEDATRYLEKERKLRPDWDIQIFDSRSDELPITLDWEGWVKAHDHDPNTLSGVANKFRARNIKFQMKE